MGEHRRDIGEDIGGTLGYDRGHSWHWRGYRRDRGDRGKNIVRTWGGDKEGHRCGHRRIRKGIWGHREHMKGHRGIWGYI